MGIVERRARQKASLRREILDAARELFIDEGYERVTMRRLAEKIEYSPTTIYLYFEDKADLLNALCEETFAKLVGRLERIRRKEPEPVAFLRAGLREYVDFGLKHPGHYKLTFIEAPSEKSQMSYHGSVGEQAFNYLRDGVARCVESGAFKAGNIDATSQALWAAVHGIVALLIAQPTFPFVDRRVLADHAIDTMIAGLRR